MVCPNFKNRSKNFPRVFHFIRAGKKSTVADDAIPDEPLISFGSAFAKVRSTTEIHIYRLDGAAGSRDFAIDPHRDSLIRLDPDRKDVPFVLLSTLLKKNPRSVFENDRDFGDPFGHPFPCP